MLYVAIVAEGMGERVIRIGRENGLPGATILLGRGTCRKGILTWLCLDNPKREIVLMAGSDDPGRKAMEAVATKLKFEKHRHGIIFSTRIPTIIGASTITENQQGGKTKMAKYQAIYVIIDRGKAEEVTEAARSAGATGATILNARGSGIHEAEKIFQIPIEPEKEVVLILTRPDLTEPITNAIRRQLEIDKPGKGIIFVQDVEAAYGLFEEKSA